MTNPSGAGSDMQVRLPIVVVDSTGDIELLHTLEEAGVFLEWHDVEAGEYVAYDAEGRLVELSVHRGKRPVLWGLLDLSIKPPVVIVTGAEEQPTHRAELVKALVSFLEACRQPLTSDESQHLEHLLARVMKLTRRQRL